ncbi:MAG: flagellar protein FlgN [Firmicutes bacterium]|nr:flagellar protein FlgN [Bacillota bacterium]
MQVIDVFIQVVKKQLSVIQELIGLAERKREQISNAEQVAMITHQEEELLVQLERLEKERHQLFDIVSPGETMPEWLERTKHPVLTELFQELQEGVARLQSVNLVNQELISESLNFIQFSLNLFINDSPSTYEKKGQQSSHKSLFDRKV